jgi:DNA-binding NarL/FixJ family response regulator
MQPVIGAIPSGLDGSPKTIEAHRIHLQRKLRLDNLAAPTRDAIQHGLTTV